MSDCQETDFFWESWTGKRKKTNKKDKECLKRKNNITMKTDGNIQKKKKNSKFKESVEGRKEKEKEQKNKKNRLTLELCDSFIFTQSSCAQANPTVKPETLNPHSSNRLKSDQDCRKKTKRKKKVAFDLSSGYICVKRPKFVSSSQQSPKESILLENGAVRDSESCSQVTVTGHRQGQTHANDSQCTSDDIYSQDLFITQKTFRASPSKLSSGEGSDKAVTRSPQMFTPRDTSDTSMAWIKQHLEGSNKCPQDSHFHQHHRKTNKHVQKPKTVQVHLTEEERLNKAHQNSKKEKSSFQTQMELNVNPNEEKKVSCPAHITPSVAHLCEPIDVNPFLDVAKSKKRSRTSSHKSPSCLSDEPLVLPRMSTRSISSQTENFFTTELSSYCNFCQKSKVTVHREDLKPLDLSLPRRARKDLGMCLSVKTLSLPGELKDNNHKEPTLPPACSSDMKDVRVKKDPFGRHPWSTLSPQSEFEPKSADTSTSSEDDPPCRTGKLDLTQVRAVQMRLNESFFFKTKGEGQSPRPESPLMKLAQGREMKSVKGH